jgi:D-beta-D-heptose 7-phosphate kinase/D-beta-D-heptose 1-phosphate adenosyltransferase
VSTVEGTLSQQLERFRKLRVAVVGDLFLERVLLGRMTGVAAEGPTPVLEVESRRHLLGGAGYAAEILAAFGCQVEVLAFAGDDEPGRIAGQLLEERGIVPTLLRVAGLATPVVTRVLAMSQREAPHEAFRLRENPSPRLPEKEQGEFQLTLRQRLPTLDAVLLVEQGFGLVPGGVYHELEKRADRPPVVVGDLQSQALSARSLDALVLNVEEAAQAAGKLPRDEEEGIALAENLRARCGVRCLLLTRGSQPAIAAVEDEGTFLLPVEAVPVFDVTGAGETVSSVLAMALGAGMDWRSAAELALRAASLSVTLPGRAVVHPQELLRYEQRRTAALQAEKIVSLGQLRQIVANAKRRGLRVVWTNGCFDLLHVGHILYLEKAKQLGDLLIVGINSDASVRATKGPGRPIVHEAQRARLLASLSCIDYVLIFDDPSPKDIIAELKPDVYVKGGDYTVDTINQEERRIVEGYGGEIALLPGMEGMSTTELIRRILAAYTESNTSK